MHSHNNHPSFQHSRGDHRPILPSIRGLFSDELGKSNDTQHDASRMDNTVLEGTSSRPARWPSRGVQPLSGPGMRPKLLPSLSSGSLTPMLPRMKIHPPESQWEGITFPPLRPLPSIAAHPPPLTLPPLKQRPLDPDARFQQSSITNAYSLDRGRYMRNNAGPHDGRIPDPYDHVLDYVDPSPGASRHSETISRETFYQPGRSGRSNSDRPPRPQAERTLGADDDVRHSHGSSDISHSQLDSGDILSTSFKYGCTFCGKRFKRPSGLRIHLTSHTGEKAYICPEESCGRSFSVLSNMRRHFLLHFRNSSQEKSSDDDDFKTSLNLDAQSTLPPT